MSSIKSNNLGLWQRVFNIAIESNPKIADFDLNKHLYFEGANTETTSLNILGVLFRGKTGFLAVSFIWDSECDEIKNVSSEICNDFEHLILLSKEEKAYILANHRFV